MPINHCPVTERPREQLLSKGVAALSDAELLAVLLRNGIKGKDAWLNNLVFGSQILQ